MSSTIVSQEQNRIMIWQPNTGTFCNKRKHISEKFYKITCVGIADLRFTDHDATLNSRMSHYLIVLVTYKEEANILYSDALPGDRGKIPDDTCTFAVFFSGTRKWELSSYQVISDFVPQTEKKKSFLM